MTYAVQIRRCPIAGCHAALRGPELLCREHWLLVPGQLRHLIWRLYRWAPASVAHRRACAEAVLGVRRQLLGDTSYAAANHYEVVPVCTHCHAAREKGRGLNTNRSRNADGTFATEAIRGR